MGSGTSYDDLVAEALAAPFSGWDFSFVEERVRGGDPPWNYDELATAEVSETTRLLDVGTGGGETLAGVLAEPFETGRRPAHLVATESWPPNVPVARALLEPLGIEVRQTTSGEPLPAEDGEFNLVLNRHSGCDVDELHRVLAPGGVYLTQGVGRSNDLEFNEALGGPPPRYADNATLEHAVAGLERQGFELARAEESFTDVRYLDIGAVVFHLLAVSWQVPGFDVTTHDRQLRAIDATIRADGPFVVRNHRFLVRAIRP